MKKFADLGFLFFLSISVYSQDYLINFAGTGGSTSVDSVKVENLTQGTNLTVNGADILNLKAVLITGINNVYNTYEKGLKIYPNPVSEYTSIEFIATAPGNAVITIYNQVGKTIVQQGINLETGTHIYQINDLSSGFYTVRVASETYSYTGKIVSLQKGSAIAGITRIGFCDGSNNESRLKSANTTVYMQYNAGDRLKFTGISGNYSTIVTDIPTESKTIAFDFIACTDGDNNNYPVVNIGPQVWMAENLKYLPGVVGPAMGSATTPYYYVYGYDGTNVTDAKATTNYDTYGVLYNWPAAMNETSNIASNPSGVQGVCPTGWHLPSDAEWTQLTTYLGGDSVAGGKLKETGTTHWYSPNTGATNETGFTALPGAYRDYYYGGFNNLGSFGLWWSSSENAASDAWGWDSRYNGDGLLRSQYSKLNGFSVRCVRDENSSAPVAAFYASDTSISEGESIAFTDQSTNNPTSWNWDFGDGGTSAEQSPSHTYSTAGTYTVGLTATNSYGSGSDTKTNYITVTGGGGSTVTDTRDSNVYKTVTIGTQVWMAENLKYLPSVVGPGTGSQTMPYYYVYGYDGTNVTDAKAIANYATYGVLYNWTAAMNGAASSTANPSGVQGVCPTGWHVPADAEWTTLENYLIANGYNYDNTTTEDKTAKALASSSGWSSSSEAGVVGNTDYPAKRNVTGFSALPGGFRGFNGTSYYIGDIGYWWSATESNTLSAWNRGLGYENGNLGRGTYSKEGGISVRCVRDENGSAPVAAFAASNTNISTGESVEFTDQSTHNPTSWIWDFGDGGTSTIQNPSHTFSTTGIYTVSLIATNSYGSGSETKTNYITVTAGGGSTLTDTRDGNVYQTVTIETQVWMAENLKYMPSVAGPATESETISYYYVYDYDGTNVTDAKATANYATYGVLYNWTAAMNGAASSTANPSGVQGVCPTGWHLPSDAEWSQLTDYIGGVSVAGGKLKETGTTHWSSPNTGATNETGFTALPGGCRDGNGTFDYSGNFGYWWSATELSTDGARGRGMYSGDSHVYSDDYYKEIGFSVRCMRD